MTNFTTSYRTAYTEPISPSNNGIFISNYSAKNTATIISGKTRPSKLKFKSRVVTK